MAVDTSTTAIPLGETAFERARRTVPRPIRRAVRFVATSDPDLSRLRSASTTITCLMVVAIILFALAAITGQSAAGAIPGLILTMLACNAVREPRPKPRAVSILLLVPSSIAAVTIASSTHDVPLVADIVFVAIAMAAVFVRVIGQRGVPIGMVAFMSYFIAIFTKVTFAELPAVACAVTIAALVVIALRYLLRPRHPDRDLRRMLTALGVRAGRVLDALDDGVRSGLIDERLRRSVASRLAASSSTAAGAEQALDDEQRLQLSGRLRELRRSVHCPVRMSRERARSLPAGDSATPRDPASPILRGVGSHISAEGPSDSDERLEALSRVIRFGFT